jgi:hypothetical protein
MIDGFDASSGKATDAQPWIRLIDGDHAWRIDGMPRFCDPASAPGSGSGGANSTADQPRDHYHCSPTRPADFPPIADWPQSRLIDGVDGQLNGGHGNFPLWASCQLRPAFRKLFADWESAGPSGEPNFPDLGDPCLSSPEAGPRGGTTVVTGTVNAVLAVSAPSSVVFPPLVVGATSAPIEAPVRVTSNNPAGYQLSVSRTAFSAGDIPLSIRATTPTAGQVLDFSGLATPIPTSGSLNVGHRSGAMTSESGDSWTTSLVLGPIPAVASGVHTATVTFTTVAL